MRCVLLLAAQEMVLALCNRVDVEDGIMISGTQGRYDAPVSAQAIYDAAGDTSGHFSMNGADMAASG
ncbi:MAG: hypothetical protein AAGC77_03640 [Pseudomonadota bacterium]